MLQQNPYWYHPYQNIMSTTEALCLQRALSYYSRFTPANGNPVPGQTNTPNASSTPVPNISIAPNTQIPPPTNLPTNNLPMPNQILNTSPIPSSFNSMPQFHSTPSSSLPAKINSKQNNTDLIENNSPSNGASSKSTKNSTTHSKNSSVGVGSTNSSIIVN